MKKKIYFIVIGLFLAIFLFGVGTTLAKYFFSGSSDIIMDIGKFIIKINETDVTSDFEGNYVLDNFIFPGNEYVKPDVLAPGSTGYYDFLLDASDCDVSVRFDITISDYSDRIKVYIDGEDFPSLVKTTAETYSGLILLNDEDKVKNLKIVLDWPFEDDYENNTSDTSISSQNVQIPFSLKLKQYTGEGLIEFSSSNLYIDLEREELIYDAGTTSFLTSISGNARVKDSVANITYNFPVSYSIPSSARNGVAGSYSINYKYDNSGIEINRFGKLILAKPKNIDFDRCNTFETVNATINCSNGIATLRSTNIDPQVTIPISESNYINPKLYRYVAVRYKVSDSQTHLMGIFTEPEPNDETYFIYKNGITNDNQYHEVVFDLWSNNNIYNLDYIKGLRFDFSNNNNTTMYVDYIKFLKTQDELDYIYFNDFNGTNEYTTYNRFSNMTYTKSNSILDLTSTTNDSQISMTIDSNKQYDPNKYNCLYVKYRMASGSSTMEFFMVPNPVNQTYSIRKNIIGNGNWNIAVFDASTNGNVLSLPKIEGWRFDPVASNGIRIEVDYIGVSDRCINQ